MTNHFKEFSVKGKWTQFLMLQQAELEHLLHIKFQTFNRAFPPWHVPPLKAVYFPCGGTGSTVLVRLLWCQLCGRHLSASTHLICFVDEETE